MRPTKDDFARNTVPLCPVTGIPQGYSGNLTVFQKEKLKRMWVRTLEACDFHQEVSTRVRMVGGPSYVPKRPIEFTRHQSLVSPPNLVFNDADATSQSFKDRRYAPAHEYTNVYGGPLLREAFWEAADGEFADDIFLRLLRARDFDVEAAVSMAMQMLSAWYELDVPTIIKAGDAELADIFRRGPAYIQGYTTAHGQAAPVFIVDPILLMSGGVTTEAMQRVIVLMTQNLQRLMATRYGKAVFLVDLGNVGGQPLDWQVILFAIKYFEHVMIERMEVVFLHRSPWSFRGIWQTLIPLIDPRVRAKIRFTHRPKDLEDYVPLNILPLSLGGTAHSQWRYVDPRPDENRVMKAVDVGEMIELELQELMRALDQLSLLWAEAVPGSDEEEEIDFRRMVLQVQIRLKQLQMRPYEYATHHFNRTGVLREDASVKWKTFSADPGKPQHKILYTNYSIPALIDWLNQHGQDTLEQSFGGRYGACGTERTPDLVPMFVAEPYDELATTASLPLSGSAMLIPNSAGRPSYPRPDRSETDSLAARSSVLPRLPSLSRSKTLPLTPSSLDVPSAHGSSTNPTSTDSREGDKVLVSPHCSSMIGEIQGTSGSKSSSMVQDENENENENEYPTPARDDVGEQDEPIDWIPPTDFTPHYIPTRALTKADVALTEAQLKRDRLVARAARDMVLAGQLHDVKDMISKDAGTRMYPAYCMAVSNTVKALLTFDSDGIVMAMTCCSHALNIAELLRKRQSKLGRMLSFAGVNASYTTMSPVQFHAELLAAELRVLLSLVTSAHTRNKATTARVILMLKTARKMILNLSAFIEAMDEEAQQAQTRGRKPAVSLDEDFRSGVWVTRGLLLFVVNSIPHGVSSIFGLPQKKTDTSRALKYFLAPGGWRNTSLTPGVSSLKEGLLRPAGDIFLLLAELIGSSFVPIPDLDYELCDSITSWYLIRFPKSPIFLHTHARLFLNQALPEQAIELFRSAMSSQALIRELHHACLWDLATSYIIIGDWQRAYDCYDTLSKQSNWSKALFQWLKAVVLYELDPTQETRVTTIMRTVPALARSGNDTVALESWMYMVVLHIFENTPIFTLVEEFLPRIDNKLQYLSTLSSPELYGNRYDYFHGLAICHTLRGVVLCRIAYPAPGTIVRLPPAHMIGSREEMAEESCLAFQAAFQVVPLLTETDSSVIYCAHLEHARLRFFMGQLDIAKAECLKVLASRATDSSHKSRGMRPMHAQPPPSARMYVVRAHHLLEEIRAARRARMA